MSEFAWREGKVSKGIIGAALGAIKFLVVPLAIIYVIISMTSGIEDLPIQEKLEQVRNAVILVGIPLIGLGFFTDFYPKGSYSRMTFGIVMVAVTCVWIWLVTLRGELNISIESVGLNLDFSLLVLLFIFAASLKAVYYLAETPSYRKEWLDQCVIRGTAEEPPEDQEAGSEEPDERVPEGREEFKESSGEVSEQEEASEDKSG